MSVAWQGVFPAATTQFQPDQALDIPATLAHLDRLIEAGMHGLIMLGTVGENCSLEYAEKLEVLRATVDHVGGRVPVLSGVAEYTTALACRFASDAEKIGVDGLMVLPAHGLQVRPARDDRPFPHRRPSRPTCDLMVYNNPVSYQVDITPGDVRRAGRRAQPGGHQGIVGERPPDHRSEERLRRSLRAVLRGRRPGARERSPGRDRLGLGPGQRVPGREPPVVGPGHGRAAGTRRGRSIAGTRRSCISIPTSSWCSTSSWLSRSAGSARKWSAPRGCRSSARSASEILAIIRRGIATRPELSAKTARAKQVSNSERSNRGMPPDIGGAVQRISVIDTHTGGEPTRVVIAGGPDLGSGTMAERLAVFRDRHDTFRSAVVNEPRGSDVMVGAILLPPVDPACAAGVIFFNNVGYLGMCGHGTIGVAVALAHLGRIGPGSHRLETPVGDVTVTLEGRNTVTIDNVESYRLAKDVEVDVPGLGDLCRATSPGAATGSSWCTSTARP